MNVDPALFESLMGESLAEAELRFERTKLCDLLHGRRLRSRAADFLEDAVRMETFAFASVEATSLVGQRLDAAVHAEWIATIAERGQVVWGNRNNRCGRAES